MIISILRLHSLVQIDSSYVRLRDQAVAAAEAVAAFAAEVDESSSLDPRILAVLRSSRLTELAVPAAYGGRFESVDPVAICVVREVLLPISAQLDSLFALQGIGSYAITVAGSEQQRTQWLPRVAAGDALAALAITEPDAGSDLRSIGTTLVEESARLRLNGVKAAISNAGVAAFYIVLAKEGELSSAVCSCG